MKKMRSRYVFTALVVPWVLACPPVDDEKPPEPSIAPSATQLAHQIVDAGAQVVRERLEVSGRRFHRRYANPREHEPICLPPGWKVEWSCPLCARGEGGAVDFMIGVATAKAIAAGDCEVLREQCAQHFQEKNLQGAEDFFSGSGSESSAEQSPFAAIQVDAPRVEGRIESFAAGERGLEVEGAFLIPRISGDGLLRAGPLGEGSRGRCFKVDYFLYDAKSGKEVDRIDPHIVGGG